MEEYMEEYKVCIDDDWQRIKSKVENILIKLVYRIDYLSFCMIAARGLEWRLIIVIIPDMNFSLARKHIDKLEKWPRLGRDDNLITKEIWTSNDNGKEFDIYEYKNSKWLNKENKDFDLKIWTKWFGQERVETLYRNYQDNPPKLSRGRIDRKGGCVYFLHNPYNNMVKIGKTTNLKKRLQVHKISSPEAKLLGFIKSSTPYELESDLHGRFMEYHVEGEWFKYRGELKKYIDRRAR